MVIPINRSHIEDQIAMLMYAWGYVKDNEDVEVSFDTKNLSKEFIPVVLKISKRTREEVSE